jgi:tRNA(Arg) A34 adenosine deaminase TadA
MSKAIKEEREIFMKEAYSEAQKAAERGDYGIGCVIVLDGKIISRSGNEVITRGIVPYAHGESLAFDNLRKTEFDNIDSYRKMSVYTTLAPCPQCWGRMIVAGVKEVIYSTPDQISTQNYSESIPEIFKLTAPKVLELGGDLGSKCKDLFEKTRIEIDKKFFR